MNNLDKECVFCSLKNKTELLLYEDTNFFVIKDNKPKADIHVLIISKQHIISLKHIKGIEIKNLNNFFEVVFFLQKFYFKERSFKIICNNGTSVGQEIMHLHFHVISD